MPKINKINIALAGVVQTNTLWTRPTTSTIKVEPRDTNQPAYFVLSNSSQNTTRATIPASGLTWDITSTAAIGGTRTGAEATDTAYEIYAVSKADGSSPALISEVNGTALSFVNLATVDATYTLMTPVVSFGSNTLGGGGDLADFSQCGTTYQYRENFADLLIHSITSTSVVAADMSDFLSYQYTSAWGEHGTENSTSTFVQSILYFDAGGTLTIPGTLLEPRNSTGYARPLIAWVIGHNLDPPTAVYAKVSNVAGTQHLRISGFTL